LTGQKDSLRPLSDCKQDSPVKSYTIQLLAAIGTTTTVMLDTLPSECPYCHYAIQLPPPKLVMSQHRDWLELISFCPRVVCNHVFIAQYKYLIENGNVTSYNFTKAIPVTLRTAQIQPEIQALSSNFVAIYNQALTAEAFQLDEICGIGLRKALEFLLKDYCIRKHPGKDDEIKKKMLAAIIKDYITDQNIKDCALRATWLGNDETHYVRKWTTHDVNDLKILIRLTLNWIDNELLTEKYKATMPSS
jgi:hypothetical protein